MAGKQKRVIGGVMIGLALMLTGLTDGEVMAASTPQLEARFGSTVQVGVLTEQTVDVRGHLDLVVTSAGRKSP